MRYEEVALCYEMLRYVTLWNIESETSASRELRIKMAAVEVLRFLSALFAIIVCANTFQTSKDEYLKLRNSMLHKDYQMRFGGDIKLSDAELQVNDRLMKLKAKELDLARTNTSEFPPAVHFFRAKALIDKSEVFSIIRNIPKGKPATPSLASLRSCCIAIATTSHHCRSSALFAFISVTQIN